MSWTVQNLITLALLAAIGPVAWRLSRREYWQLAWRELRRRRAAMVCGVILALYALVAVADSIGWRRPLRDENGQVVRHPETAQVIYDSGHSLLDYALTGLRTRREKTYSAPLAAEQFTSETALGEDGRPHRIHPPLQHPRHHLLGTDRVGTDVLYQAVKSIRTGLIIGQSIEPGTKVPVGTTITVTFNGYYAAAKVASPVPASPTPEPESTPEPDDETGVTTIN